MQKQILAKHLFLNVSSKCNLNCDICYGHLLIGNKSNMDLETAKAATDFYYNNRDPNYNEHYIMFFGGEPLLNFDIIPQYLQWFEKKFKGFICKFFIFTNGILLDREKADFFITHNIPVFISYDTDKEYFARLKNGSDNYYDHVTGIIRYIISQNPEMVIPYYILHEENLVDLLDFCNEMLDMGISKLAVTRKMYTNWENEDICQVKEILNSIVKYRKISILIYPEIVASCKDCYPHNMMAYPSGDIYDLCLVCASSLYKLQLIQYEELSAFYMGNIFKDKHLKMDVEKKKEIILKRTYSHINSHCPTLTNELDTIRFLWDPYKKIL